MQFGGEHAFHVGSRREVREVSFVGFEARGPCFDGREDVGCGFAFDGVLAVALLLVVDAAWAGGVAEGVLFRVEGAFVDLALVEEEVGEVAGFGVG